MPELRRVDVREPDAGTLLRRLHDDVAPRTDARPSARGTGVARPATRTPTARPRPYSTGSRSRARRAAAPSARHRSGAGTERGVSSSAPSTASALGTAPGTGGRSRSRQAGAHVFDLVRDELGAGRRRRRLAERLSTELDVEQVDRTRYRATSSPARSNRGEVL